MNPRELRIRILPSPDANRLFIYTGTAYIQRTAVFPDATLSTWRGVLNLSRLHHRTFDGHPFNLIFADGRMLAAPTASLAYVHGKFVSGEDYSWGVNNVDVDEENRDPRLLMDLSIQGTRASLNQIAYQVNVLVHEREP